MRAASRWSPPTSRSSPTRDDYEAHDALICIAEGRLVADTDRRQLTPEHRFKTRAEMAALFADLPEALASTVEIARRCAFRPRDAGADPAALLGRRRRRAGRRGGGAAPAGRGRASTRRLAAHGLAPGRTVEDYRERLDFELGVIERMKYPGYFLIVADFIQWAKAQGIPVGPGRGSGAGSLVAYALTITDLDPIRFGLLFERFLNPERVSMPDFDIDFCQDRRDEVIHYVQEQYGARPGRADHHLRHAAGARRAARRRPRAADALRAGRQALQARAAEPGQSGDARAARSRTSRACRPRATASRWSSAPSTSRRSSKGLHRHASTHAAGIVIGERPLDRAGAALSRSEIATCRSPSST